jgi:hypothetical protein
MLLNEWNQLLRFDPWQHFHSLAEQYGPEWLPQPLHNWLAMIKQVPEAHEDPAWWVEAGSLEFEDDIDVLKLPREMW